MAAGKLGISHLQRAPGRKQLAPVAHGAGSVTGSRGQLCLEPAALGLEILGCPAAQWKQAPVPPHTLACFLYFLEPQAITPGSWQYAWPSQHSLWHRFLPASKLSPPCTQGSCGSESPLSAVRVWSAHAGWMWARASPPPSLHASCPHCPGANPNFAQELEIYCRAFGLSPIHP